MSGFRRSSKVIRLLTWKWRPQSFPVWLSSADKDLCVGKLPAQAKLSYWSHLVHLTPSRVLSHKLTTLLKSWQFSSLFLNCKKKEHLLWGVSKRGDRNEMRSPGFPEFWITSSRCRRLGEPRWASAEGIWAEWQPWAPADRLRESVRTEHGDPPSWSQGSMRQIKWGLQRGEVILITVAKSLKNQEISELKYPWMTRFNPSKFRRPPVVGKQVLLSNRLRWIGHPEGQQLWSRFCAALLVTSPAWGFPPHSGKY